MPGKARCSVSDVMHANGPVVRTETLRLFEFVEAGGTRQLFPFEREIVWVRESETKIMLRLDAFDVDESSTFTDFYGFLTSLTGAITDDVKRMAKSWKLKQGERFAVELDTVITDKPLLPCNEPPFAGRKAYRTLYGKRWLTSDVPVKVWDDGLKEYATLKEIEVANVKAIYSTRRHPIGVIPKDVAAWIAEQKAKVAA